MNAFCYKTNQEVTFTQFSEQILNWNKSAMDNLTTGDFRTSLQLLKKA